MGCDIHLHTECKVNGVWLHVSEASIGRNYKLFAYLADVRNADKIKPLQHKRKGMPNDPSTFTEISCKHLGSDGHSHSYLDAAEILLLEEWFRQHDDAWPERQYGYLFGNSWGSWLRYPEDRPKDVEDIRFVFWFDN